jgi:hypothetical protein
MTENRPSAPAPGVNPPPQERSTAGRSPGAEEEHERSKEHWLPDRVLPRPNPVPDVVDERGVATDIKPIDWEARIQAAVAETLQKRQARRAERQELDVRRQAGLTARHARKLARNRRASKGEEQP